MALNVKPRIYVVKSLASFD